MRLSEHAVGTAALQRLASRLSPGTEVGSSRSRVGEVAGEDGLEEGAEDNLGTTVERQLWRGE